MFLSYKWRDNRSNALACILKISVCKRIDSIREVVRLMLAHPTVLVPDTSLTSFSSRISQEMHPYVTDYLINYILWNQQRSRFLESCTWGVYTWCYLLLLNCFPETAVWFFLRQFKYGEIFCGYRVWTHKWHRVKPLLSTIFFKSLERISHRKSENNGKILNYFIFYQSIKLEQF